MKHFKTFAALLCAAVLALAALLAACGGSGAGGAKIKKSEEGLLVLEATETGGSLADALAALKEAGELTYEGSDNGYGLFITSINGYAPAGNAYWAIYTTLESDNGVRYASDEFGTYEYGGTTLLSALYGASGLPLIEGELYLFAVATF